jgi:2',3'-cyclic-nucleotide 2'-phosphodiesterase (5'-nucleotidase family)
MSVDECGLSGGKLHLELLSDLGLDAFVPGNNEFCRASREALSAMCLGSPFPWLLSTVEECDGRDFSGFHRSLIVEKGEAVGLLGALHRMDFAAEELHGLKTLDHEAALAKGARELRSRGAKLVVLLSHCGLESDLRLAAATEGLIDVIVGGHSHSELREPRRVGETLTVQAGSHGSFVGELELELEGGRIVDHRYALHETEGLPESDEVQGRIVERYRDAARSILEEGLCVLEEAIPRELVVRLAAELLRRRFDADLAFMFAPAASGGLAKGPLRLVDVYDICRSFISLASFEITGRQIAGLLRERDDPSITGARGVGIGFRPQGQAFGRLEFSGLGWEEGEGGIANIRIGGEALDPERWYRAGGATHLFSSESGGYPSMDGSRNLEALHFTYLRDELADAFRSGEAQRILHELPR